MNNKIRHYLTLGKALPYEGFFAPNKAMLTGKELGDALRIAIEKKGVLKKDVADHFGVKPPSVQDWIKFGRIGKRHLNELVRWFSDVVPASHWGIDQEAREAHSGGRLTANQGKPALGASSIPKKGPSEVQSSLIQSSERLASQILRAAETGLLDERGIAELERNLRAYIAAAGQATAKSWKGSAIKSSEDSKNDPRASVGPSNIDGNVPKQPGRKRR